MPICAETLLVDMGMMYRFFVDLMQAGIAVGLAGGNAMNARGANPIALVGNNYAKLSRV